MKKGRTLRSPALFVLVGTTSGFSLLPRRDEKVELSDDRKEPVNVTLCIEDWAVLITALASSSASLDVKERINSTIFQCAKETERTTTLAT